MRYLFDRDSNALVITFAEGRHYRDSEEVSEGVVVDYDTDGRPYAIEFLRADTLVDVEGLVSGQPVRLAPRAVGQFDELTPAALQRWRDYLALSQQDLASRLGIPAELLESWENGTRPIENPGVLKLALQAVEGNAHEEYLRQALRDVTESLQAYLRNEPPLKIATGGRS